MTDRMATCPSCAKPVRLTEDELIQKRGFCAVCDTEFDVQRSMLQGGPFRAIELAHAAPVTTRPPSSRVHDLSDGRGLHVKLELAGPLRALAGIMAGLGGAIALLTGLTGPWIGGVVVGAISVLPLVLLQVSRQDVFLNGTELVCIDRIGGVPFKKTPVSLAEIVSIDTVQQATLGPGQQFHHVRVIVDGRDSIKIGGGQCHSEEAMSWLTQRLREALRKARQSVG